MRSVLSLTAFVLLAPAASPADQPTAPAMVLATARFTVEEPQCCGSPTHLIRRGMR